MSHFHLSNPRKIAPLIAALGVGGGLMTAVAPAAHAQSLYLVGAYLYSATSTGATAATGYQFDTNSNDGAATLGLSLNGTSYSKNIAIALATGANNFSFNTGNTNPGSFDALGLFFSTTPASYDPGTSTAARTPDLLISSATNSTTTGDFVPATGTTINSYFYGVATTTANGLTNFTTGSTTATVSGFASSTAPAGTFTITTSGSAAAPEPVSIALLALAGMPALGTIARRRRRTSAQAPHQEG